MGDSMQYAMLITSLPWLGPLFAADQTPLSRLRLENRLRHLDAKDAAALSELTSVLHWIHLDLDLNEAQLIQRVQELETNWGDGFLSHLLRFRLELRTAVAALRRRRRGEKEAPVHPWGYGRWVKHIERYWSEPGFRLQRVFPWIEEAEQLIEKRDSRALERLQMTVVWNHLTGISIGHEFDFEAVVIYVMRWDLLVRWSSAKGEAARERFDQLVDAGLGKYAHLFSAAESVNAAQLKDA